MIDISPLYKLRTVSIRLAVRELELEDNRSNRTLVGMALHEEGWSRIGAKERGDCSRRWGNPKR
jgi:hypothetical protein